MPVETGVTLILTATIKEGRESEFVAMGNEIAQAVRAEEAGCLAFEVLQRRDQPRSIMVYEQYRDQAALLTHQAHLVSLLGPPPPNLRTPLPAKLLDFFETWDTAFYRTVSG